jgi:hypothetical protein
MMSVFLFLNGFFFCTYFDNDFKFFCITFCKLYPSFREPTEFLLVWSFLYDRLCVLVVRVLGYRSGGLDSISGTTRIKKSSGSGTGSTQPREYN